MVWAIGDIQGCYGAFSRLLKRLEFDAQKDKLWIAGDLVNRGTGSLETLRYIYSLRNSAEVVLGNHDIALIAAYMGIKKSNETIEPILAAPDGKVLIDWLRDQKFLHYDKSLGYAMSHAGISPQFNLQTALKYSEKLEKNLRRDSYKKWLENMFEKSVANYDSKNSKVNLERYALATFTRMRFCYSDGTMEFNQKGGINTEIIEGGLVPWFKVSTRHKIAAKIIFGHWSTLGYYNTKEVMGLDTGCVWGGKLSAVRLDGNEELIQVECDKAS